MKSNLSFQLKPKPKALVFALTQAEQLKEVLTIEFNLDVFSFKTGPCRYSIVFNKIRVEMRHLCVHFQVFIFKVIIYSEVGGMKYNIQRRCELQTLQLRRG